MKTGIGLFGSSGHQIQRLLADHPRAELVAMAAMKPGSVPEWAAELPQYDTLAELLANPRVELVSFCSPRRAEQAQHCLQALAAGKHVYAEKPCALYEADLDALIAASREHQRVFHEMAGTVFAQPWWALREVVRSGRLGPIVQVVAQKSYPMGAWRPQDEAIDGGLMLQNGVHALRFVEHLTGLRVATVQATETQLGNPGDGHLRVAAAMLLTLENGANGVAVANYLNQPGLGSWGNEMVRVFGTEGFVEGCDGGSRTRLVIGETDHGPLDISAPAPDFFDLVLAEIRDGAAFPLALEEELHPTRIVIRAKAAAGGFEHGA